MRLFPESENWVCKELINPTTKEINTAYIRQINEYIRLITSKDFNDWTFDEFVNLLNGVLSINPDETKEMVLFNDEILESPINGYTSLPYINKWDLCALLLIIKKIIDENLTTCENPLYFILGIITKLKPHMYSEDEEDNYRFDFSPNNFTYSQIENDEFMRDFFYSNLFSLEDGFGITITNLLNSRKYPPSFLLLNDSFKMLCYENVDSEKAYSLLPEELKNDINFIKKLLKNNGGALEFLSNEHKSNKELVLIAVKDFLGRAICFASEELQSNREFIITCLKSNNSVFRFLSPSFRSDKEIVLLGMEGMKDALYYASSDCKSNKEIVTVAIKNTGGEALQYAAKELQDDPEFIISVVTVNAKAFEFVSNNFKGNRAFLIEVFGKNGLALEYIDENLKANRKIVIAAVNNNGLALQFADEDLKSDEEIAYKAVYQNGLALNYVAEKLLSNRDFMNKVNNI